MPPVFGLVPHPPFTDRLIPDTHNRCYDNLGQRSVKGVVYHRQLNTNWGTDAYFRAIPPGGLVNCPRPNDPPNWNWGGCNALTDYGVDHVTGEILRWNDPLGRPFPGVGPNRSGWASGPAFQWTAYGDGAKFLADHNWDRRVVNRDQASIEIGGQYNDGLSEACKDAVAALSAYWADQFKIAWTDYPRVPGKSYNFTRWHNEFCGFGETLPNQPCPGLVVMNATGDIIERTKAILKRYQDNAVEPFAAPRDFTAVQGALGRQGPGRDFQDGVRQYQTGEKVTCDGFVRGQLVLGDDRWLRTTDAPPLWLHTSGVEEEI